MALYPLMLNKMTVSRDENGQFYYTYQKSQDELPKDNTYMNSEF